jgi:hypothetical protein
MSSRRAASSNAGLVDRYNCGDHDFAASRAASAALGFHPCRLSAFLWQFTGITPDQFKEFVATGAGNDEEGRL